MTANFDRIARAYRWMEYLTLGRALERCRERFLDRLTDRRSALVFGDGDGRFLAKLVQANRALEADAVDTSAAMLDLVKRRTGNERVRTHCGDALTFVPERTYDLVVTHFFLDCLTQTEAGTLVERVVPHLAKGALWVVSDFRVPAGAMRRPAAALVRGLYLAFRVLTGLRVSELPDHAGPLRAAGFVRLDQAASLGGMLISELWGLAE